MISAQILTNEPFKKDFFFNSQILEKLCCKSHFIANFSSLFFFNFMVLIAYDMVQGKIGFCMLKLSIKVLMKTVKMSRGFSLIFLLFCSSFELWVVFVSCYVCDQRQIGSPNFVGIFFKGPKKKKIKKGNRRFKTVVLTKKKLK
jgi:hypothetical protein